MFVYKTKGTCSQEIQVELDGNIVKNVKFVGGCNGNTQGVAKLAEGMTVDEVAEKLSGIKCGFKPTSCPDQLANAVKMAMEAQNEQ